MNIKEALTCKQECSTFSEINSIFRPFLQDRNLLIYTDCYKIKLYVFTFSYGTDIKNCCCNQVFKSDCAETCVKSYICIEHQILQDWCWWLEKFEWHAVRNTRHLHAWRTSSKMIQTNIAHSIYSLKRQIFSLFLSHLKPLPQFLQQWFWLVWGPLHDLG